MKTQKRKIAIVVLAMLTGGTACAWANVAATVDPGAIGWMNATAGQSIGWRFFVDQEITITHLGVYDNGDDGLVGSHIMGIWRVKKTGGLQLERQVSIGPGGTTENHHVYVALSEPFVILPDPDPYIDPATGIAYYERWLVGVWSPSGDQDRFSFYPPAAATRDIELAEIIRFENYTWKSSSTFTYPWGNTNEVDHFGVNFKYTANHAPVAVDDSAVTQINTPVAVDVLADDSDPDGDPLSIDDFTPGAHGCVVSVEGKLVYTPDWNFVGDDSFTYTIGDGNGDTATATVSVTVNPGTIAIDIKPGSYPNSINLGANGVVPVAVLSNETFDATRLDPDTVFLDGLGVAIRGKGNRSMSHCEDVNGDGRADLVVQFDTENLVPGEIQDGMATVTVDTSEGRLYLGEDEITIVPPLP